MKFRARLSLFALVALLTVLMSPRALAQSGTGQVAEEVGTADAASVSQILPFLNTQSDSAGGCSVQTAAVMRFDTTGKTGNVESVEVDVPILAAGSLVGNIDLSLAEFPNDFTTSDRSDVGAILATESFTSGNYPSGSLTFTRSEGSDPLVQAVKSAVDGNEKISFAVIISACTIGTPAIQFTLEPTILANVPTAVDHYSFRPDNSTDYAMMGLGLLVIGLLVGTGYTVIKRRRTVD